MTRAIFRYWIEIFEKAWKKTKVRLGIAGLLLDFLLAISGTLLYHRLSKDPNYSLGEILFGFMVFILLIVFVFSYYAIRIPAMQDIEQKEIISKINTSDLRVGIGEDFDDIHGSKMYLGFQSFYEDTDIAEMFVQLREFFVSRFSVMDFYEKMRESERREICSESKYVGKTLRWITENGAMERISLKPNESGRVFFLEGTDDSNVLHFGIETKGYHDAFKNDWGLRGLYEVHIDVYGKIHHEERYRKRSFVILVDFHPGIRTEIIDSRATDFYFQT